MEIDSLKYETCRKCGGSGIGKKYDPHTDMLIRRCGGCGCSWNEVPMDSKGQSNIDK